MSRLYIYLLIFSSSQLRQCMLLTNIALRRDKLNETTTGEVLKYFGILIILSKFKFIKRRDLWSNLSQHRVFLFYQWRRLGCQGIVSISWDSIYLGANSQKVDQFA